MISFWKTASRIALAILVAGLTARPGWAQNLTATGSMRLQVDAPAVNATVSSPFAVGGWALDLSATTGTGIDAVHVWAVPVSGPATFLGAATLGGARADVGA